MPSSSLLPFSPLISHEPLLGLLLPLPLLSLPLPLLLLFSVLPSLPPQALNMNYLFATEFIEIYSPLRAPHLQGGGGPWYPKAGPLTSHPPLGNAILSRYPLLHPASALHTHQPGQSGWEAHADQPRKGGRVWVSAVVQTPLGSILCYSCDLIRPRELRS